MSDDPASRDAFRWEIRRSFVERLHIPWEGMGDMANQQRAEAAIQISTMMDEIEACRQAMQKAERDIAELRGMLEVQDDMVKHYVDERDEARRECCRWMAEAEGGTPEEHANEQGWDCWNTPGGV